ncbi:MAG: hypothetical protein E5Y73_31680 [Mesorhizobium sp.]|uniref:hypothetical protein n=1 Tax=Mesorhizobium sp. TaxID=1871066 RepID=UPI00120E3476|nr:hypothetical protein [Mesorhizobium sp.]TIL84757.1 MAG: hypothetical protein E5Y73_31680 [Mesorhizobium sp.]
MTSNVKPRKRTPVAPEEAIGDPPRELSAPAEVQQLRENIVALSWHHILSSAVGPESSDHLNLAWRNIITGAIVPQPGRSRSFENAVVNAVQNFFHKAMLEGPASALGLTTERNERAMAKYEGRQSLPGVPDELRATEIDARVRLRVVDFAGGNLELAAIAMSKELITAGKPLPPLLVRFVVDRLDGGGSTRKGPKTGANSKRDIVVFLSVMALRMYGFKETRNFAARHNAQSAHSACSHVAAMAGLSEDAIVKIVTKWRRTHVSNNSAGFIPMISRADTDT